MAKRAGLGRGLGALLGETAGEVEAAQGEGALRNVPIAEVTPNPDQPRQTFDEQELEELTESIRQNGILQPIVVREKDGAYQIIAGERRFHAAQRAGIALVPVIVRTVSDDEVLQLALIENLQRSDLNPLETALGYKALIEQNGMTQAEVGKVLGKSRSAVANALRLLDLPEAVQQWLREGSLTAGHARAILAVDGEEAQLALAQKVIDEQLSVRQTEILAPLFSGKTERIPPKREPAPQTYKDAAKRLRDALTANVSIKSVRGKQKIEIEFANEEELAELVDKIAGV